ncbi:MAG: Flp pilus assembly protein CpaB [Phycisphaerae bacterium]
MNRHALIPLLIGLVFGIAALKFGYDYVSKMKNQGAPDFGPMQKVVVASKNLPMGTKLSDADVNVVSMPTKLTPEGSLASSKDIIGQTLRTSLTSKMPIIQSMVGPGEGLEGVIPSGYRAVAVKVDEFTSVAGLLRPGVKVDVLATFNVQRKSGSSETISKLVLQNIEVRAVGQQFKPEETVTDSAKLKVSQSVTLLVKSDQAEVLQLAASMGSIRLALRSANDAKSESTKGITLTQLVPLDGLGDDAVNPTTAIGSLFSSVTKKPAVNYTHKKINQPYTVEVTNGDRTEEIYFASADSDTRIVPKKENTDNEKGENNLDKPQVQAE